MLPANPVNMPINTLSITRFAGRLALRTSVIKFGPDDLITPGLSGGTNSQIVFAK
jgi:hypothetical protein